MSSAQVTHLRAIIIAWFFCLQCTITHQVTAQSQRLDYSTLSMWKKLQAPLVDISSVAFSPNDRMLAAGSNGKVVLWDGNLRLIKSLSIDEGKEARKDDDPLREPETPKQWMRSLVFTPDGKEIAAACYDGTVRIWEIETGRLQTLKGHEGPVWSIALSPDGTKLVSGGADKSVRLWDTQTGKELQRMEGHVYQVVCVSFSTDGKEVVSLSAQGQYPARAEIKRWDTETGNLRVGLTIEKVDITTATLAGSGRIMASTGADNIAAIPESVNLWDAESGELVRSMEKVVFFPAVTTLAFSPDLKYIVGGGRGEKGGAGIGRIRMWSVRTGRCLQFPPQNREPTRDGLITGPLLSMCFSHSGKVLALTCEDASIELWAVP